MFLFKRKDIYYVEYYDQEKNCNRRISTKSRNKADALKFVSDLKRILAAIPRHEYVTLNKFRFEYQGYIEKTRSPQYLRSVKLSFKMLFEELGDIPLAFIRVRDLEKFFLSVYQKANHAAHLYHRTLKAGFNKAVEWNYLSENPIQRIKLPKIPKTLPVFITNVDLDIIIANTKNHSLRDLFFLGFHTGMRQNEITNLTWDAVNLTDNVIKVQITDSFMTKNKRERIIPINESLRQTLLRLKEEKRSKYVFANPCGYRFNNDYVSHQFKKAVRSAELDDRIHFHDLRHGFASTLVQNSVSLYVVKELLGHENQTTTQMYSHLQNKNLHDAVKVLTKEKT